MGRYKHEINIFTYQKAYSLYDKVIIAWLFMDINIHYFKSKTKIKKNKETKIKGSSRD